MDRKTIWVIYERDGLKAVPYLVIITRGKDVSLKLMQSNMTDINHFTAELPKFDYVFFLISKQLMQDNPEILELMLAAQNVGKFVPILVDETAIPAIFADIQSMKITAEDLERNGDQSHIRMLIEKLLE